MNSFASLNIFQSIKRSTKSKIDKKLYESSSTSEVLIDPNKKSKHLKKPKLECSPHSNDHKDTNKSEKLFFSSPLVIREHFEDSEKPQKNKKNFLSLFYKNKEFEFTRLSCNFFPPNNKIRAICLWIKLSKLKHFSLLIVLIHSTLLGFYDFNNQNSEESLNYIINILEPLFLSFYAVEMVIYIIAMGFYAEPHTYMRNFYNVIDFLVVITAIFSYNPALKHLGVLRLFRVLSYIENLNFLASMKIFMSSLQKSLIHLFIILTFLAFTLMVFSTFSLNWWKDFDFSDKNLLMNTEFDNIKDSFLTNYEIYMKDSWQNIYYLISQKTNAIISAVYLIVLLVICLYFISNMFVAVILSNMITNMKDFKKKNKSQYRKASLSSPKFKKPEDQVFLRD